MDHPIVITSQNETLSIQLRKTIKIKVGGNIVGQVDAINCTISSAKIETIKNEDGLMESSITHVYCESIC